MSLVLDALRRQQADREPGTAASLALTADLSRRERRSRGLLVAALLANAAVLAALFHDRLFEARTTEAPVITSSSVAPAASEPAAARIEPPIPIPASANPAAAAVAVADSTRAAAAPGSDPAPAEPALEPAPAVVRSLERRALDALPPGPRARFPGIVFSTHVYADDPSLRAIVANGVRLGEGDAARGLTIREITPEGVVLEFEDFLVEVPIFTDWQ